ncbi:MAG: hypothetical protein V4585_05340 [Bacteroidota bacterium]
MKILLTFFLLMVGVAKPSPIITSVKIGNWAETTTWDLGRVPTGEDIVVIAHDSVSITGNAYLHELRSEQGGKLYFAPTANLIFQ